MGSGPRQSGHAVMTKRTQTVLTMNDATQPLPKDESPLCYSSEEARTVLDSLSAHIAIVEESGLILLYTMLTAIPEVNDIVLKYIKFDNVDRYMRRLEKREDRGEGLSEKQGWFRKKVEALSVSFPLPGSSGGERSWREWEEGVRKAVADPDDRWNQAVLERIKTELEARRQRIINLAARVDPEAHSSLIIWMANENGEIKWLQEVLNTEGAGSSDSGLLIERRLSNQWKSITESLRGSEEGGLLLDLFSEQAQKCHSLHQLKLGVAIIRSVLEHPILSRSVKDPDLLSCLHIFVRSSYRGVVKMMLPSKKAEKELAGVPGFTLEEGVLKIDLASVSSAHFLKRDIFPVRFDWTDFAISKYGSFKSLILSQIDNETFLNQALSNPKISGKPGIVSLIAQRCRSSNVLSTIANRRELYTGFANKDVPLSLIMNPARIPVSSLRKFIHVRYIDKMTLMQLSNRRGKGGQVREEIRREIKRYLNSR